MRRLFVLSALLLALPAHALDIDWVEVGDPGNTCKVEAQGCFGSVDYVYRMGRYEVTNAQYEEFLNAVAATDTYSLYNPNMSSSTDGGITQSGSAGSYTYDVKAGMEDKPVNFVSFWDALRFANWLHNGQGSGDTETGAYTITPEGIAANSITRNADATVFLTSGDEWYKAAYFNGTSYFEYPTASNTPPTPEPPPGTDFVNGSANYNHAPDVLTDVGAYQGKPSDSPYGTFDQGGNVMEWTEAIDSSGSSRVLRGGSFKSGSELLSASWQAVPFPGPSYETSDYGFRVAMIPESIVIDIKPGNDTNPIEPFSRGLIPVAVLTTEDFDALTVDEDSALFGPAEAEKKHKQAHVEDVDGDGDLDLVLHFRTQDTGIAPGDTEACLIGQTYDGVPIMSCDSVRTVPPN